MPAEEEIRESISKAQKAADRRDWQEALRCWDAVRTHWPQHVPAHLGVGNALREAGRYKEAEAALGTAAERFPDNEPIAMARAWLANQRQDWPTAVSRWESIRARFPDSPWGYVGGAKALSASGRPAEVETLLAKAENILTARNARSLNAEAALNLELEIAKARVDWPAARRAAEKFVAHEAAPSAHALLTLAQACWHSGDVAAADAAAGRALATAPALSEAVLVRAWVATDRGDGEAALACYRRLVELNPETVRWSLKLVQLLNRFGRVKEALERLENIRSRWPNDPMVRKFLRNYGPAATLAASQETSDTIDESDPDNAEGKELQAIADKAPKAAERVRLLLVADPASDVLVGEVADAESAVLVFTGSNDAVSIPLPIFDLYLATLRITTIYLKDFKRLRFLTGIQSLSEDYSGTLTALRDLMHRLGIKRLCTLGNCDGGFAAIRYGVELEADRVVAFSPPTYNPHDSLTKIEQARNFMRNRLAANVPPEMVDLKPFLESRSYPTQIELFYEQEDPRDRNQALRLSGLPGIKLHPQPWLTNHYLLRQFALRNDDFPALLANLLGIESRAAPR